jgi:hypothetical protein
VVVDIPGVGVGVDAGAEVGASEPVGARGDEHADDGGMGSSREAAAVDSKRDAEEEPPLD